MEPRPEAEPPADAQMTTRGAPDPGPLEPEPLYPPPPGGPYPPPPPPGVPLPEFVPGRDAGVSPPQPLVAHGPPRVSGLAIASLVVGILWFYWLGSILALVLGYMAKREIDASRGAVTGRGFAIAGIVLGWIGVGIFTLLMLATILAGFAVTSLP